MIKTLILTFTPILLFSQVGINTTTPNNSSVLDVFSNNKGVLFPRVSLQSITDVTTVVNPAEGLLVWNTNNGLAQGKGFFYFLDGKWVQIPKQFNSTGKTYEFVEFKQTSSSINMTSSLQELTQLSTTYTALANGNLFLNYTIYATMNNSDPRVSNVFCEIQVTDNTTSTLQKGTLLVSPVNVINNQGSNAVASPSVIPISIINGHNYTIKIYAKEAYLDTNTYTVRVGTVNYTGSFANSSLIINSLLNNN